MPPGRRCADARTCSREAQPTRFVETNSCCTAAMMASLGSTFLGFGSNVVQTITWSQEAQPTRLAGILMSALHRVGGDPACEGGGLVTR